MSRLINADELKSKFLEMGCMDGKPCYGVEIIDRMPTVQAVPIEELKEIRQEIEQEEENAYGYPNWEYAKGLKKALEIIDNHIKQIEGSDNE